MSLTEKALEVHVLHFLIAADAGCAGVGRHGRNRRREPIEVTIVARKRAAGLRAAMGGTWRCANHIEIGADPLLIKWFWPPQDRNTEVSTKAAFSN
jgi:hypothetical protein